MGSTAVDGALKLLNYSLLTMRLTVPTTLSVLLVRLAAWQQDNICHIPNCCSANMAFKFASVACETRA